MTSRVRTGVLLVALLATSSVTTTFAGAAQAEQQSAPAVATAAAATLPEVTMTCAAEQTDINHASAEQLAVAFGIDIPVASRLIGYRPFLAVRDLSVVEGIGPGKLGEIQAGGRGCATPTSTPPPASSPCETTSKVDLQSATAEAIAKTAGVNGNAAERIVAARPFANLSHVTPERVAGVGKGTLDSVIKRSCLTPQPIRDAAASWRWAYPAYTTTVVRDGYALTAPAGVVDSTSGAWASITPTTPLDPVEFGLVDPTADMHIHGAWADGVDKVTVTLPPAPYLEQLPDSLEWVPVLKHEISEGNGENVLPTVDPATGALSAQTTTLSVWSSIYALKDVVQGFVLGNRYSPPTCRTPWQQRSGTSTYDSPFQDTHVSLTDSQLNLPGNRPTPGGFLLLHCVGGDNQPGDGFDAAVTTLRNNSGAVYIGHDLQNNSSNWVDDSQILLSNPATVQELFTSTSMALTNFVYFGQGTLLGPGDQVQVATPAGTRGVTDLSPNIPLTVANSTVDLALANMLQKFGGATADSKRQAAEIFASAMGCLLPALQVDPGADPRTIAQDAAQALYSCFINNRRLAEALITLQFGVNVAAGPNSAAADIAERFVNGIWTANKYLQLAKFATSVVDSIAATATQSDFVADHFKPVPTRDAKGRPVQSQCVRAAGSVNPYVDEQCQDEYYAVLTDSPGGGGGDTGVPRGFMTQNNGKSFFLNQETFQVGSVPTGGDYVCFAKAQIPVRFHTDASAIPGYTAGEDAKCAGGTVTQPIGQALMDANAADPDRSRIRMLRSADTGAFYLYVGRNEIQKVPDFNVKCFSTGTKNYLTYDFVSQDELQSFYLNTNAIPLCQ